MQKGLPTPKGFRDLAPTLAKKKREVILKIAGVLEEFGFEPIETPTIEFAETLKGKYGEEEKLIYGFKDRGGRDLALRYDLTVPLARYVATYNPPLPFRRYQIGQVFRGENPQAGRYREFTQFDFDTVGSANLEEDTKIIGAAIKSAKHLGIESSQMLINDRKNFEKIPQDVIRAIDKMHKVGEKGVKEELLAKNLALDDIENHLFKIKNAKPAAELEKIFNLLEKDHGLKKDKDVLFDATLARGLDYYTGAIFELKPSGDPKSLSIGSGGRYDNLISMFSKKETPAVGFSFGLDRLIEALG
ncbi:histidine--tRNA ligase [Candidatus Curtissbacteria bacterium RIFCSPHIGHO2_02_FULL_42_15]|uniref:Histidine--tRNA ligase n=1 Tax=Candidatus Curtissbacteria bacterium RIFCSPHIGHO2_02_FULL_42_15 TaxID=1797716 RepID=A0A1F5GIW2_9BACT|nr:MAG: histidine--tRNA ligase [Candidatus Curtissbacteria bacterium RIFCSPHIGHO2_02_FULL_42_15]